MNAHNDLYVQAGFIKALKNVVKVMALGHMAHRGHEDVTPHIKSKVNNYG